MGQIDTENEILAEQLPLNGALPEEIPQKRTVLVTQERFRELVGRAARDAGTIVELARRLNLSGEYVGLVISGKRGAGKKMLSAFGAVERKMIEIEVEAD